MLGLVELVVVLVFGIGWAVIELMALRLDRRRKERAAPSPTQQRVDPPSDPQ